MTVAFKVTLNLDTQKKVEALAGAKNQNAEEFLAEVIEDYVTHGEARRAAWADADKAWDHYVATGLHATAEEVDAWLAKLEAGEDAEPPECHV